MDFSNIDFKNLTQIEKDNYLLICTRQGSLIGVNALLQAGASSNASNDQGQTVLMMSVYNGYSEITARLINANAKLDSVDKFGRTALKIAFQKNHEMIIFQLLEAMTAEQISFELQVTPSLDTFIEKMNAKNANEKEISPSANTYVPFLNKPIEQKGSKNSSLKDMFSAKKSKVSAKT